MKMKMLLSNGLMHSNSNGKQDIAGEDNVLGKANVRYIEGANVLVLIYDPYAKMICCQNYISLRVKDSSLK
jgi:hypothetical protein